MARFIGDTSLGRQAAPPRFHGQDAVRAGPDVLYGSDSRVKLLYDGGLDHAGLWVPEAGAGLPCVEVENLLPIHAFSCA